ncbi:hypothetical protein ACFLU4_04560 [Chloroflexota bacterium]
MGNKGNSWKSKPLAFVISLSLFLAQNFLWASSLTSKSPKLGYALFLFSNAVILGWWVWLLMSRIYRTGRFARTIKLTSTAIIILAFVFTSPMYIDFFVQPQGNITMPMYVNDSSRVTVHYGTRKEDFFWTDKTIGELKQKKNVSLNVNGEDIFSIYTEGKQIYMDAQVFAGYSSEVVPSYATIGSTDKFSITISGYMKTDSSSIGKSFSYKSQPIIIKNKALNPPVEIVGNGFSREPEGWNIKSGNKGLEIFNECGIPVLILNYNNPYEITISGLFVTSFGVLKVDNSDRTIFEFGDSPYELGMYIVDGTLYPRSIFDFLSTDRVYRLRDYKEMMP